MAKLAVRLEKDWLIIRLALFKQPMSSLSASSRFVVFGTSQRAFRFSFGQVFQQPRA